MSTYTVHAPPPPQGELSQGIPAPERFVFVRDGFYVWAFLLAPVWLLARRLWLALLIYVVLMVVVAVGLKMAGVSEAARGVAGFVIALGIGFEASSIWRWTLTRRRWTMLGFVVAEDLELAERRFFAEWSKPAKLDAPRADDGVSLFTPVQAAPAHQGAPSSSDIIGLFPAPEAPR